MKINRARQFIKDLRDLKNQTAKTRLDKVLKAMHKSVDGNLNNMLGDRQLQGSLRDFRELHLDGDCLLVYKIYKEDNEMLILLDGLYTHKELKKKQGALALFSFLRLVI
jgi:addiction module RelE/StbE family toxin